MLLLTVEVWPGELRTMLVKVLVAGWGERRWRCVASPGLATNGLSPLALFLPRSTEELKAMHAPRWRAPPEILPKPQLAEAFRCIDTPFPPSGATAVAGSDQKRARHSNHLPHNNHSPKPKNETIFRVARLSPRPPTRPTLVGRFSQLRKILMSPPEGLGEILLAASTSSGRRMRTPLMAAAASRDLALFATVLRAVQACIDQEPEVRGG